MKECCRTGDEQKPGKGNAWLKGLVYLVIFMALALVIFKQITL